MTPQTNPPAPAKPPPETPSGTGPTGVADRVYVTGISYTDSNGQTHTAPPTKDTGEALRPMYLHRQVSDYAGSPNTPGWYYSHTDDEVLRYETWLECRWLQLLDFDPFITHITTQPFTVHGLDINGPRSVTPDIYAETANGGRIVVEPHHPDLPNQEDAHRAACLVSAACDALGWTYYCVHLPPKTLEDNVDFLLTYARDIGYDNTRNHVLDAVHRPMPLHQLWDDHDRDALITSTAYHLMWTHELRFDATARLTPSTIIWRAP